MTAAMRIHPPAGYRIPAARPAATLIMLRPGAPFDVFMQRRHETMAFAPGALVFPGGRAEAEDGGPRLRARLSGVPKAGAEDAVRIVTAIRETFEESGVLFACEAGSDALIGASRAAALAEKRAALNRGALGFADLIEAEGLALAGDRLKPFARWVTPWWHALRYDTHFFVARAPDGQVPAHDGGEAVESIWLTPSRDSIDAAVAEALLLPPTQLSLQRLAQMGSIEAVLAQPEENAFRLIEPWLERRPEGYVLGHPPLPGEQNIEMAVPRLSRLGIGKELADAIAADLAARGWRGEP